LAEYDEVRTLKVSRFQSVRPTGRSFEKPADFSLSAHMAGSFGVFSPGRTRTVRVAVTGWAATNVREQRWHESQRIVEDGAEQLLVEFRLDSTVEFKRWILGFGRFARVLQPDDLAGEIRDELRAAAEGYDS
jgi:predicted DNA-binding transcriptional regulator YafY